MAKNKKEIQGLGDVIETITESIGINTCESCNQKKFTLNRLFNFKKVKSEMINIDKIEFGKWLREIDTPFTELSTLDSDQVDYVNKLYEKYFGLDISEYTTFSKVHIAALKDLFKLYCYAN
jgi:hypothetical protein